MRCRQIVQELDEQVAADWVGGQQGFVEQERGAFASTTEHLTERQPEEQRHLVAGAVRQRLERHHVGPFAAKQAEREMVGVDINLDVSRTGQHAETAPQ